MTRNEIFLLIEELKKLCAHSNTIYFQGKSETHIKEERQTVLYTLMSAAQFLNELLKICELREHQLIEYMRYFDKKGGVE